MPRAVVPGSRGRWIRAALVGPCVSVALFVSLLVFAGHFVDPALGGVLKNWLYGLGIGGALAVACAAALIAVDVVFERAELRKAPVGLRAWIMSAAMPFVVIAIYQALEPRDDWGPSYLGAMLVPIAVVALVMRFTFSEPTASAAA